MGRLSKSRKIRIERAMKMRLVTKSRKKSELQGNPSTSADNTEDSIQMEDPPPSDNVSTERYPQLFTRLFCKHCNVELEHTIVEDQTKVLIARVYRYFECEYEELKKLYGDQDLTPLSKFRQRTALATGVSETTVLEILKEEEIRNAEKREEPKRSRALKRSIQTKSSSVEDSSDDSVSDGGQPSNVQEAQNEAEVETLVVKLEPECDQEQVQMNTGSVQVKVEPPDDDVNDAVQMEVIADVYQHLQQTQQQSHRNTKSTQTRPCSSAERQRRFREKRKADIMNACTTFSQSSDVQPQHEQPQHDVQINKCEPQTNAERLRKYRKLLREQQREMEDMNAITVLSNTSNTSSIHQLQNVDQAELARKRHLNKQRQSRFRARHRFVSPSTSSQEAQAESTSETLAVTEPAAAKRRGSKSPRTSDVTSPWQQTHGESSTATASSSVRLTEELDESGLSEETEVKMEEIEIGEEGFS